MLLGNLPIGEVISQPNSCDSPHIGQSNLNFSLIFAIALIDFIDSSENI